MEKTMVEATYPAEKKVQNYYTWRASSYDAGAGFEVEHHLEATRLADVQKGQRVLDVACGTGGGAGHPSTSRKELIRQTRVRSRQPSWRLRGPAETEVQGSGLVGGAGRSSERPGYLPGEYPGTQTSQRDSPERLRFPQGVDRGRVRPPRIWTADQVVPVGPFIERLAMHGLSPTVKMYTINRGR